MLIYSGDFRSYPMGGVLEYAKNFARYAPVEVYVVGLTLDPSQPVGHWNTLCMGTVARPFLPILYVDEHHQRRSRIPLNYRFVQALRRYRNEILSLGAPLYIQRAEHGLPFLHTPTPLYFNTHGQSAFVERWTSHPLFRWRWFRQWFYRTEARVIQRAQGVIVISPADYDFYVSKFPTLREKFHYIPLGVETEIYRPPATREAHLPTVLFVGRLDASKGLDLLIAGFARFRQRCPNARLILVGGSQDYNPVESEVRAWIAEHGVESSVQMTGLLPREAILPYYQSADVFVLTSRWEGLPNALLEALACGLPAVVTAVGGLPSVIRDDWNGYVLHERDPDQLADLLERAYRHRDRLSEGARATAQQFSIEAHVQKACQQMGLVPFDSATIADSSELSESELVC
ncbi:Mannosylfructose-phosphate synthase [bacterium HR15]|nr:Mannosylfructose-phosphate synthase [bacterium HR15]